MSIRASIVIPTFRRPAQLRDALFSCLSQTGTDPSAVEIVVVDNCPDRSARGVVEPFVEGSPFAVQSLAEPRPGISHARNTGVAAARGRLVAFLDDDQTAHPRWLSAFVAIQGETGADALFGPILARADVPAAGRAAHRALRLFSRSWDFPDGADVTARAAQLGTNNALFVKHRCLDAAEPFAPDLGLTGGEDSLLLRRLRDRGRRFAWAREAVVDEVVPAERLLPHYVRRRRFRSGQIRTMVCARTGHPLEAALWMAGGLCQAGMGVVLSGMLAPFDRYRAATFLEAAAAGAGKLLWAAPFRRPMYGAMQGATQVRKQGRAVHIVDAERRSDKPITKGAS